MNRNLNIEKRIEQRKQNDNRLKINSYGGMGMDGISGDYKIMILEELDYISSHPEIYNNTKKPVLTPYSLFPIMNISDKYASF